MAILDYVSINVVIAKIIRDSGIKINSAKDDIIEWLGEGITAIGHHSGFKHLNCVVEINGYKGVLPDYYSIRAIEYNNVNLPISSTLRHKSVNRIFGNTPSYLRGTEFVLPNLETEQVGDVDSGEFVFDYNNEQKLECWIEGECIWTTFEKGEIVVHYLGYNVDDCGFPLIPNTYEHIECLYHYVLYKWIAKGNIHPVWDLKNAKFEFERYLGKAQNRAKYPSLPEAQRFMNSWVKIVKDNYATEKLFDTEYLKQNIKDI